LDGTDADDHRERHLRIPDDIVILHCRQRADIGPDQLGVDGPRMCPVFQFVLE
jgi:hypothetical protein